MTWYGIKQNIVKFSSIVGTKLTTPRQGEQPTCLKEVTWSDEVVTFQMGMVSLVLLVRFMRVKMEDVAGSEENDAYRSEERRRKGLFSSQHRHHA